MRRVPILIIMLFFLLGTRNTVRAQCQADATSLEEAAGLVIEHLASPQISPTSDGPLRYCQISLMTASSGGIPLGFFSVDELYAGDDVRQKFGAVQRTPGPGS